MSGFFANRLERVLSSTWTGFVLVLPDVLSYAAIQSPSKLCLPPNSTLIRVSYRQSRPRRHQPHPVTLLTHRFGHAVPGKPDGSKDSSNC